jgi:gluconokinase
VIVILMGVAGAGKTAVGERLAARLGWRFLDADDFHPQANVRKMAAGEPLADEDRWPWLAALREAMVAHERSGADAVVACSALKEAYRRYLLEGAPSARIVHLRGTRAVIEARLRGRQGHFMPVDLLASQLATLEEPTSAEAAIVDVDAELDVVVERVMDALRSSTAAPAPAGRSTGPR